jgi:hypothetical protein
VETFQDQVAHNHHLSSASWFRYEDTCSKQFFDFHRIGRKRALLKELMTDNETVSGQNDFAHYIRNFYECLHASDTHASGTTEVREECWDNTPIRVSNETNSDLPRDLSLKEILDAISSLPKGKAPGCDDIPTEFFHECTGEIIPTILKAFTTMFNLGETSTQINKGIIMLIPKSGDHSKLGN